MSIYLTSCLILFYYNVGISSIFSQHERCTRRFTAGYCLERVRPVWTFVFQYQDCVMRLGCLPSPRANRFFSHSRCIKRCKLLLDIYSKVLMENANDTLALRSKITAYDPHRRENIEQDLPELKNSPDYDKEYQLDVPDSYLPNLVEGSNETPEVITVNVDEHLENVHVLDDFNGK